MDEGVRARLEAIAHRPRSRHPDIAVAVDDWPTEMLKAAQWVWARRVFNETGSIQIAARLRAAASAAGVTDVAVKAVLERLEEDEQVHAQLAGQVLTQLGGTPPRPPEEPLASDEAPAIELARLVLVGLSICETVSAARYAAVRTHTDRPGFRQCIELFLRDEILHSELGFLLLPVALERLSDAIGSQSVHPFVQRELRTNFRDLDQTIGLDAERRGGLPPPRPQPPGNPGVVEPAVDARAFYEAVETTIVPKLERLGLDAATAWRQRWTLAG